jgi:protein SCO1
MRVFAFLLVAALAANAQFTEPKADPQPGVVPPSLTGVGIDQNLDAPLPLNVNFTDEAGRSVPLGTYFGKKPVVLALVYYECPMLCTEVLNGMVGSLKGMSLTAGADYEVVAVSFDPKDTPQLAALKKQNYARRYGRAGSENAFHFLTGQQASIDAITKAAGFRYKYDEKTGQFAHASAIFVATPDGRLSRYFYGVEYPPRDLRLGLVEASQNKIGNAVDQLLLFCYHYDPSTGKYGAIVMNIVRLSGGVFLAFLATALVILWRRDVRRTRLSTVPVR